MSSDKPIIVIGAGIIGASIAWHLAKAGAKVTVLAGEAGGVATPNSFAWINASWGNPEYYFHFRRRAIAEWTRLASDVPGLPLFWCGGICWDLPPDALEAYALEHAAWGYGIRRIGKAEIAAMEPNLGALPDYALHVAEEGVAEPLAAAHALLADAGRLGAVIRTGLSVDRILTDHGRITGVETSVGIVEAERIVLAAGAGASALAAAIGVDIPVEAPAGLLVHSRPHPPLLNSIVLSERAHLRQTAEGRIVAGSDFGGTDPGMDAAKAADELFATVREMLPEAGLELDFHTVGYRPTPVDGFPIIGPAPAFPGLYVAVMHSGITLAPLVGKLAAGEILSGDDEALLAPYRLARFG